MAKAKQQKRRQIYREAYTSPGMRVYGAFLPVLPHLADGSEVVEAYLREAGKFDDGLEFQTLHVIVRPPAAPDVGFAPNPPIAEAPR